jgi:hypothetical protein
MAVYVESTLFLYCIWGQLVARSPKVNYSTDYGPLKLCQHRMDPRSTRISAYNPRQLQTQPRQLVIHRTRVHYRPPIRRLDRPHSDDLRTQQCRGKSLRTPISRTRRAHPPPSTPPSPRRRPRQTFPTRHHSIPQLPQQLPNLQLDIHPQTCHYGKRPNRPIPIRLRFATTQHLLPHYTTRNYHTHSQLTS